MKAPPTHSRRMQTSSTFFDMLVMLVVVVFVVVLGIFRLPSAFWVLPRSWLQPWMIGQPLGGIKAEIGNGQVSGLWHQAQLKFTCQHTYHRSANRHVYIVIQKCLYTYTMHIFYICSAYETNYVPCHTAFFVVSSMLQSQGAYCTFTN